jgi:aspartokinase/homoserine dehydrogenase 1
VESSNAKLAKVAIEKEFQYEILNGEMNEVIVENELAIVAAVGENMKHNPGTSGRMFNALGKNGINISAIAQGSSELNISAVIKQADISKALNVLHEAFFLSDRKVVNLFLVGTGLIGKSLIKMIANQHAKLAQNNLLEITIAGVANSRKMLFNELGLPFDSCIEELHQHGASTNLQQFVEKMKELNLSNSIFIDCTSSGEVIHFYEAILNANISIVTPNKKANSGSYENYQLLKSIAFKRGVKFLYETNVGAGLPVINTLNDLLLSGDRVIRIEAVLSGTLNFIFSSYDGSKKFSDVVKEAQAKGYTEPDPRDDLNGMDVARKILILARETGLKLEMEDVSIENLVPQDCREFTSVDDFYGGLETHDIEVEQQVKKAASKKEKLRYMAVLENGKAETKLVGVGETHPFYSLAGSDNIILLTTERYSDRPMVIRGPGAGAEVTAAGVFADVIRIGNYAGN